MKWKALAGLTLLVGAGCSGGEQLPTGPSPVAAAVEFRYVIAEPAGAQKSDDLLCTGQVHLYPSFWGYAQVLLYPVEDKTWGILFEEVPVGHHTVRVEAPEGCSGTELIANGATLGDQGGSADAFSFTVHSDGSVTP